MYLDLEVHPHTERLLKIGGWRVNDGQELRFQGDFELSAAMDVLFHWLGDESLVVGHNIIAFDWPMLVALDSRFADLRPRLIDTLILNPLAFPRNPYHHLVKDYKKQKDSVNDPVADCRVTERLLLEQCTALAADPANAAIYGALLQAESAAFGHLFRQLTGGELPSARQILSELGNRLADDALLCQQSLSTIAPIN